MSRFVITDTVSGEILEGAKARKFLQALSKPPRATRRRRSDKEAMQIIRISCALAGLVAFLVFA